MQVQPLGGEDPLEEGMATTPGFLPEESHGQRSLVGYSPQDHKESDMTEATQHASSVGLQFKKPLPCTGNRFHLWLGNEGPTSHAVQSKKRERTT